MLKLENSVEEVGGLRDSKLTADNTGKIDDAHDAEDKNMASDNFIHEQDAHDAEDKHMTSHIFIHEQEQTQLLEVSREQAIPIPGSAKWKTCWHKNTVTCGGQCCCKTGFSLLGGGACKDLEECSSKDILCLVAALEKASRRELRRWEAAKRLGQMPPTA